MTALGFVGVLAIGVLASMWKGYVLSVVWAWFVVSAFGLTPLTIAQAIGIALVVSFLTHQDIPEDENKSWTERLVRLFGTSFLGPLFALAIGWVVKGFLP